MKRQSRQLKREEIQPGMVVETTNGGDIGETDVSKPKITEVKSDATGNVENVIVQKGVLFKKEINVSATRIREVDPNAEESENGKVKIEAQSQETEALTATGKQMLTTQVEEEDQQDKSLLEQVEEAVPTAEGLRELEEDPESQWTRAHTGHTDPKAWLPHIPLRSWLTIIGPGLLAGMAGNDASAVTAYAMNGASNGFGQLWLLFISTPLYQATQYASAKIGRITQQGFADILRTHYGRWIAALASLVLIVTNIALITANLVAVGTGLQLLTNIYWIWFILPVALILWYLTVYRSFQALKKIFLIMSLAFLAYLVTAILTRPDLGSMLFNTFVPHLNFTFVGISSAVALLGATISPYSMFWQVQGEKEEERPGTLRQQTNLAALDIAAGVISGNITAYFIILSTATTLYTQHKSITTAQDAALALQSVLGPAGKYLFAIGLIGSGLVAIPVLLASTSYAVAGTFGWPSGLSRKPWQSEGFYLILTAALAISSIMALIRIDPIQLFFWANVLSGILAPILIIYLLVIGNSRKIMGQQRLSLLTNSFLILTMLIMTAGTFLLFYSLITGQG